MHKIKWQTEGSPPHKSGKNKNKKICDYQENFYFSYYLHIYNH